jgi:hypothetical protein
MEALRIANRGMIASWRVLFLQKSAFSSESEDGRFWLAIRINKTRLFVMLT